MKLMLALVLSLTLVSLDDEEPIKKNPQPKDFVGKWVGKWDGTWQVNFTVTQDAETGQLSLIYEWEESLGGPLQKKRPSAARIENDTLKSGTLELTISEKDPGKANAKGNFKNPRTADMTLEGSTRVDDWKPDPGFRSLFDGKDLTGWCFRAQSGKVTEAFAGEVESSDDGRYSVKAGVLTVNAPKDRERLISALYTVEEFPKDFTLKLEFRASPNADSGVFVRKPQLQCRDYLVAGPYKSLKNYKPQDWNQIEVMVKGGFARCTCNGELLEARLKLPKTGPIGLEGDRGRMEYRHIQINYHR